MKPRRATPTDIEMSTDPEGLASLGEKRILAVRAEVDDGDAVLGHDFIARLRQVARDLEAHCTEISLAMGLKRAKKWKGRKPVKTKIKS